MYVQICVLFARRASPCSPLPTLLGAASAVLASSPCDGCCFRFLSKWAVPIARVYLYVQVHTNLGLPIQEIERDRSLSLRAQVGV